MADSKLATTSGLSTMKYTSAVRSVIANRTLTGLLSYSVNFRDTNLINNPYKNRYYLYGISTDMNGFDRIGDIADVYSRENHIITFLDDAGGLLNYTESKGFMPTYSDYKGEHSLLTHEIYIVSDVIGENSNKDSESVADYVQDRGKDILKTGGKTMYVPRLNENYAAVDVLFDEEHVPGFSDLSHITFDDTVDIFGDDDEFQGSDLLYKTNRLFKEGKIHSLVNRFATGLVGDAGVDKRDQFHTAFSQFGFSRGRNLLRVDTDNVINSYENPYCRVWTKHYQYSKMSDLIRPFMYGGMFENLYDLQKRYGMLRPYYSNARLRDYSVMERGGIVRYSPDKELIFGEGYATENHGNIKNYMFSIENLAWKEAGDYYTSYLSAEQKGPFGGRIMWFPPYDLSFSDSSSTNWEEVPVIGRIEPLYTYGGNVVRSGSLSFKIIVDHPSLINLFKEKKVNILEKDVEQALLRFFAGCDDLTDYLPNGLSQDWKHYDTWTETSIKTTKETEMVYGTSESSSGGTQNTSPGGMQNSNGDDNNGNTVKKRCVFYAFYPNNVSGFQDVNEKTDNESKKSGAKTLFETKWYRPRTAGYEMSPTERGNMGGITRYTVGRTKCGGNDVSVKSSGSKQDDVICYDYTSINGPSDYGNAMLDTTCNIWKQNHRTKFDREDFGLNTSEIAQAIRSIKNGETPDSKYESTANLIINTLGMTGDEFENCEVFSLVDMKTLDSDAFYSKIYGEEVKSDSVTANKNITITYGSASSHGEDVTDTDGTKMNNKLGLRRAESLLSYIASKGIITDNEFTDGLEKISGGSNVKVVQVGYETVEDISRIEAKVGRAAMICIDVEANSNEIVEGPEYNITGYTVVKEEQVKTTVDKIKYYNWSEEKDTVSFDNEFLYFDRLKNEKDNMLYKNIKDKIKFFDPAYHSITPEGFNARLTFLNQCLRPGPTKSSSDLGANNGLVNDSTGTTVSTSSYGAGNLSFGRPPVCVLRIGDFFFCKCLFENLQITFGENGGHWDLNPEGIGVQPMIANVQLGVKIIGGQDITGPISQLQNAVSSNYYANASIYDKSANTNQNGLYNKGGYRSTN